MSIAPSIKNRVVIASAGSRKTTLIVEEAVALTEKRVLITTFTNENLDQIRSYLTSKCGCIPKHITLLSWFAFLLQHGIRPYQNFVTSRPRIESISFDDLPEQARFAKRTDVDKYYFDPLGHVFRDRAAEFVCACNTASFGKVAERLSGIYDHIFVDEVQDLAGYDLELLKKFFACAANVTAVGDPRQGTFVTNRGNKNQKFRRSGILEWIQTQRDSGSITLVEKVECYRANQALCDFADSLFPEFPKTISKNTTITGHDGIFKITRSAVPSYVNEHQPMALRWDKRANTLNLEALNIGLSKGRTFDRVVIFPTKPMVEFLNTGDVDKLADVALAKLYVAVTRARFSVAFVMD